MSPRHEEIRQGAGDKQAMGVLLQAAVTHFGESEFKLDDRKDVFNRGADFRLGTILHPLHLIDHTAVTIALVGEILCLRRLFADRLNLTAVRLIEGRSGRWQGKGKPKTECGLHV
jgi:hypothetical protein